MWFSVVCTLIDNDMRYHSGQNVVRRVSPQQIFTTAMHLGMHSWLEENQGWKVFR